MRIDITEIGNIESNYTGFTENYDSSLNEREEDTKYCDTCDGKGFDETISDCCGSTRDADTGLCYECHDHSDPSTCPDCNGTGIIK